MTFDTAKAGTINMPATGCAVGARPDKVVSFLVDTSRLPTGSCMSLEVSTTSGGEVSLFGNSALLACTGDGVVLVMSLTVLAIDPFITYVFRVRGHSAAQKVTGTATLTRC